MPMSVTLSLLVIGAIHLLPVLGVLGPERLQRLYGLPFEDTNLVLLMRHRAVMFGLLGVFQIIAIWSPTLQATALCAGLLSAASFVALGASGSYNAQLRRVIVADVVAVIAALVGLASLPQ